MELSDDYSDSCIYNISHGGCADKSSGGGDGGINDGDSMLGLAVF